MFTKPKRQKIPHQDIKLPADCCITEKMVIRLNTLSANGRLEWSLTEEQIIFIKNNYSYTVNPYLYKVKVKKFHNSKNQPAIIKKLNNEAHYGKKFLITPLKKQDIEVLNKFEISYKPVKYVITSTALAKIVSD